MIYRKWSMLTMPIALVALPGVFVLGAGFAYKDKMVAYLDRFRKEGEMLRQQDRARIVAAQST
ncbi:hypothetical protein ZOSMA_79G00030 [Zostera marina]|uniref:Uncharacterized protein n=1 Tax=Zostera marina TaxID=29655 RepID=A0A0K9NNI2_ZOSMR|nr:hypothetical protein ZOSMA_79G00030 [Zostera marina]